MDGERIQKIFLTIVIAVVSLVFGLILLSIVITQAATNGSSTNMGSFAGTKSVNDIIPLIGYIGLLIIGLGLFIGGTTWMWHKLSD